MSYLFIVVNSLTLTKGTILYSIIYLIIYTLITQLFHNILKPYKTHMGRTHSLIHVDNSYLNNDTIATNILNPRPSPNEHYAWIIEGITDNVVPGLEHRLTYIASKHSTTKAFQHDNNNLSHHIDDAISNIETNIPQHVSKELYYHNSHTVYILYQIIFGMGGRSGMLRVPKLPAARH